MKIRDWVQAARLRTLPLAGACVLVGAAVGRSAAMDSAMTAGRFPWVVAGAMTTVLLLQILSNYANDLGDAENGADDATRQDRAVASGRIAPAAMRRAVIITAILALVAGLATVGIALNGSGLLLPAVALVGLGLAGIAAAYKYTAGKNPYGYRGLGDLSVMVFFGWVGVTGTAFLVGHSWNPAWLLPGTFVGALSTAVLNLNNLRDHERDAAAGKATLVTRMGWRRAKIYHGGLLLLGWVSLGLFTSVIEAGRWEGMMWIGLIAVVHFRHWVFVWQAKEPETLDGELKKVALSTAVAALFLFLAAVNYGSI